VDPEAYLAYLEGRFHWNKRTPDGLEKSIASFNRAIAKDSKYALAYSGLADSYGILGSVPYDVLPPREAQSKARDAAEIAVKLDDSLAEAHTSLAQVKLHLDWDWVGAEREFRRAIALNSGYATARQWYTEYLWAMGRMDEALKEIERARQLDSHSVVAKVAVGRHFIYMRQYEKALAPLQEALEAEPDDFLAHFQMGMANLQLGRREAALRSFEQALKVYPDGPLAVLGLGYARAAVGRKAEARQTIGELDRLRRKRGHVPALYVAGLHAGLGEKDRAFEWLEKAYQERSDYLIQLKREPAFQNLRGDPRFNELVRRIGLPPD